MQYRAEAGAVLARGSARLPSTQLFRTGGDTTVRGYGYRDIGVERMAGVIGPGRYLASGSAEWQRPLQPIRGIAGLEQTLFIDAGAVADRPGHLFKPRVGVGTGIRVATPIGPLQADIAYGMHTRRLQLHLNVGVTF